MLTGWRRKLTATFWPLIWLSGVAMILYYAPPGDRSLQLENGEEVVGFRGPSHDLITVTGGLPAAAKPQLPPGMPALPTISAQFLTRKLKRQQAALNPVALGDAIHLWDLDRKVKRDLTLGSVDVFTVTPCADGSRILIAYRLKNHKPAEPHWPPENEYRITVFDGQTGKSLFLGTIESFRPEFNVSDDGKKLVYYDGGPGGITCLDVQTGKRLYQGTGMMPVISPDGAYLAIESSFSPTDKLGNVVIDLKTGQELIRQSGLPWMEVSFSPRSDKLKYFSLPTNVNVNNFNHAFDVLDIRSRKATHGAPYGAIFVNEGKEVACPVYHQGGLTLKVQDIDGHGEVLDPTISIQHGVGDIEAIDRNGYLIRVDAGEILSRLTWLQQLMAWLGQKQTSPAQGPQQWLLYDVRSRRVLGQGGGELVTASTDGRYAVSRQPGSSVLKVHELPLHRSWLFMLLGAAVWTLLAVAARHLWRRRLRPLVEDVSENVPASP